ncbi:hypothetical protein [Mycolicibacterium goodii]|uniref:Uncharacterized protein n=1 Tax=Mycolicibacterium goodii TaxID=134601 RepID=A0ABS6HQF4_MYCGD|nr:hypothetical protein [Mycolicibacterium goodii]MBU8824929.1 hypothetical protein [Mycolicibacterium goodii]MBU8840717.1 hypothetical protein [Mycolicibacterium goodii]
MAAAVLIAVIAATTAVTLSVADGQGDQPPSEAAPSTAGEVDSDIASASDIGPVAIITEDPTCAAQHPIFKTWVEKTNNGWEDRDPATPATSWSPEVRKQYDAVGEAMREAADQLVPLAKLTPHRVMRELYEQFGAYAREYADSIPTYERSADYLARVTVSATQAIANICAAIDYGSAAARAPLVPSLNAPSDLAPTGDTSDPPRFLTTSNVVCSEWIAVMNQFDEDTSAWLKTDPAVPASQWTPEQKKINTDVVPIMERFGDDLKDLGDRSNNAVIRDFAELSLQYRLAFTKAIPTYAQPDNYLASASIRIAGVVKSACQAVS